MSEVCLFDSIISNHTTVPLEFYFNYSFNSQKVALLVWYSL